MKVLFVALELFPFVKVGGVADGVAALAKALGCRGHHVTVALPRRSGVTFPREAAPNVTITALDVPELAEGDLYGHDVMESEAAVVRHADLVRAATALISSRARRGEAFDIVHVHDWPVAMIPYLLRARREISPSTRTVLTVHNVAFQGIFVPEALPCFGLSAGDREALSFFGRCSMLKAGVLASDAVVTVSPTHARELLTPEYGCSLDPVFSARPEGVRGILSGIDTDVWDPASDAALARRYDEGDFAGKAENKRALLAELGLDRDEARPLFAHVGRLYHEKGTDLLASALAGIVARGATVVVAGAGDPALERSLRAAASTSGARAAVLGWVSEESVHRILAAADAVLVPSRIEPCGLVPMYAQRYGALPIARRTGGLTDTIVDLDVDSEHGSGFLFTAATEGALLGACERALARFRDGSYRRAATRAMELVRSWARPAMEYELLYREVSALSLSS